VSDVKVIVEARGVYGRELFYPASPVAEKFATLLGRRALTRTQLQLVKDLGFDVVIVAPSPAQI
jgi:hypothetical protein